jgi:TetR/AcrR family transcriptional repressor of mexJK operon
METVAERAGVAKATLYSHFADKGAIFRAVMLAETEDYEATPESVELTDGADLRNQLVLFGNALMIVLTRPGVLDLGRLLISEAKRHPDLAAHFNSHGPVATQRRLANFFKTANDQRLLACDDNKTAADHLLSLWIGQRHLRQQLGLCPPPSTKEIKRHVERCVDVILRAYRS